MVKEFKLSGKEKAMIFLSALGDDASAKVLECLPEQISRKIADELNFYPKPSKEMIAHVFKELNKLALSPAPEERSRMADQIEQQLTNVKKPVEALPVHPLEGLSPTDLLHTLQNEQVQTIAYVLSLLSEGARERFYQLLSPGRRTEISNLQVAELTLQKKAAAQVIALITTPVE